MINKWKDKWFYYKLISAVLILGGLLIVYLYHMITKTWIRNIDYPFSYGLFQYQFVSFFTYQSNFIIGIWFLIASIYYNKKNKIIDNQNITFAITCYISVTCITYLFVLLPGIFFAKTPIMPNVVIGGLFFHIITPCMMIFYALKNIKKVPEFKQYYRRSFVLYTIYPIAYVIFLLIRLFIYINVPSLSDAPFALVFPYGMNFKITGSIHEILTSILLTVYAFVAFCFVIPILFVLINFFYFFVFKKTYHRQTLKNKLKQTI